MRYFAMIDGEQRGPLELGELSAAGVGPDTYVWCKGMADWEKAADVADICRFYRRRIFDLMHPSASNKSPSLPAQTADTSLEQVPLRFRGMMRRAGVSPQDWKPQEPDTSVPPAPTLLLSVFLMLFCFPITGLVAVYYSFKARKAWAEAQRSDSPGEKPLFSESEREECRRAAHDYDRQAKMWIGITFFLGMIMFAFVGHRFF